jgi:NADH-quinone oxidoreductase subunit G
MLSLGGSVALPTNQGFTSTNCSSRFSSKNFISELDSVDFALLVGCNLRLENAVLNAKLRKRFLRGNFKVYSLGSFNNGTFDIRHSGISFRNLVSFFEGRSKVCAALARSKNPLVI